MAINEKIDPSRYWHGRRVFLSNKVNKLQFGGVSLNRTNPVLIINMDDPFLKSNMNRVESYIEDGTLIDITDSQEGLATEGVSHSGAKIEDTGRKVYITMGRDGSMSITGADTPEEVNSREIQMQRNGVIIPDADKYKIGERLDNRGRLVNPGDLNLVLQSLGEQVEGINTKVSQQGHFWRVEHHEKKVS